MDVKNRGSNLLLYNLKGNDYSMYEKAFVKNSKKILNKLNESRSKSNGKSKIEVSRNTSPAYEKNNFRANSNFSPVDTKKYVRIL